jgi:hypothetical protein
MRENFFRVMKALKKNSLDAQKETASVNDECAWEKLFLGREATVEVAME